ncbi:winged helix-turn-helix transcriptional regulator [Candidatus Bathyarchaeota archaeon]|nr:winged helix-turn-helix transcriptional regulator [Candidatus Bathyarchaeota archaeon]MBS7629981.1 winged helix-turn-helix transcriptional regulator [Candidatus Bathyarchaeota archaeon]
METLLDKAISDFSVDTNVFKVLIYLSFKGSSSPSQISGETGISSGTVRPALRTLLSKGYVFQLEDGTYKSKIPFIDIISDLYQRNLNKKA